MSQKVKKEIVQGAIVKLVDQISQTMPSTLHKFLIGGATTFATIKGSDKINEVLQMVSDENGLVDVDLLENISNGAFGASNNKVQIELFNQPGSLMSMFVKPVQLTISKDDIKSLIDEIRQNSTTTEITLETKTP